MLTWGVDQSHMVPNAQSCLLRQSSSHPFSLSVQLDTGCSARHRALGKPTLSHTELGSRGFVHRYPSIHHARSTGPHRAAEPTSPWHSAAKRAGGREWCGPATAAHRAGTGTAQRGQLNPPQPHKRCPPHPPRHWPVTFLAWSLSSRWASSRPEACAILFPATRFPTIIEAGPTSRKQEDADDFY